MEGNLRRPSHYILIAGLFAVHSQLLDGSSTLLRGTPTLIHCPVSQRQLRLKGGGSGIEPLPLLGTRSDSGGIIRKDDDHTSNQGKDDYLSDHVSNQEQDDNLSDDFPNLEAARDHLLKSQRNGEQIVQDDSFEFGEVPEDEDGNINKGDPVDFCTQHTLKDMLDDGESSHADARYGSGFYHIAVAMAV
jgi:hypothetical protein